MKKKLSAETAKQTKKKLKISVKLFHNRIDRDGWKVEEENREKIIILIGKLCSCVFEMRPGPN